jgi:Domain of unknown function (DUF4412)
MKRTRILQVLALTALAVFVFGTVQARADVYMKQKIHTDELKVMGQTQPAKDDIMVFWLSEGKARTDDEGDNNSSIFLADKKVLYLLDNNKRQYSEMPLDFDKMFEQASAQAGEDPDKAEALKKMPAFMKKMVKGVGESMSAKVTETGETKTIGSWTCRKYLIEMSLGMMGKSQAEAWATEDLKIDYTLAFTMTNAMMAGQPGFEKIIQEMKKVKGVIVYQVSKVSAMGADVTSTMELLECSDKPVPAGTYEIPAGYKKVKNLDRR